jgi:hypothetical protein
MYQTTLRLKIEVGAIHELPLPQFSDELRINLVEIGFCWLVRFSNLVQGMKDNS